MADPGLDTGADRFGQGLYKPTMTRRTYAHLLECAESCLKGGINTIVDAAFLTRSDRRSFQELAARESAAFAILACHADPSTLVRRLAEREQHRTDPSDADAAILAQQRLVADPLNDEERANELLIDTTDPNASQNAVTAIRCRLTANAATTAAA